MFLAVVAGLGGSWFFAGGALGCLGDEYQAGIERQPAAQGEDTSDFGSFSFREIELEYCSNTVLPSTGSGSGVRILLTVILS